MSLHSYQKGIVSDALVCIYLPSKLLELAGWPFALATGHVQWIILKLIFTRVFNITIYLRKQFASSKEKKKCKYIFPQEIKSSPKLIAWSNTHNNHFTTCSAVLILPSHSLSKISDSSYLSKFKFALHRAATFSLIVDDILHIGLHLKAEIWSLSWLTFTGHGSQVRQERAECHTKKDTEMVTQRDEIRVYQR